MRERERERERELMDYISTMWAPQTKRTSERERSLTERIVHLRASNKEAASTKQTKAHHQHRAAAAAAGEKEKDEGEKKNVPDNSVAAGDLFSSRYW